MKIYTYEGPVGYFNKVYSNHWRGVTIAQSPEKAMSNLCHQFRMQYHMRQNSKIVLYDKYLFED